MMRHIKRNIVFHSILFAGVILQCSPGIKCIDNYKKIRKEINQATCIIDVNFLKVNDDTGSDPSLWEKIPSEIMNEKAGSLIQHYARQSLKRKLEFDFNTVEFDSSQRSVLYSMFSQLKETDKLDLFEVDENVISLIDNFSSRYVLIICQKGYHFSKKYIDKVEKDEALHSLLSIASVSTIPLTGVGMVSLKFYKKGFSEIDVAFVDKKTRNVLYHTRKQSHENPLLDSTHIKLMSPLFYKF